VGDADDDTRFAVLDLISMHLTNLRERNDLPPFDDSVPFSDDPPTVFEIIKKKLGHDQ
jgi:hypothetical protein